MGSGNGLGSGFLKMCYCSYWGYGNTGSGFYVNTVLYIFWTLEGVNRLKSCVVLVELLYLFNSFLAPLHLSQICYLFHNPGVCTFLFFWVIYIVQKHLFLLCGLETFSNRFWISTVISSGCNHKISSIYKFRHSSPYMDYFVQTPVQTITDQS